jgi:hypothetical protein
VTDDPGAVPARRVAVADSITELGLEHQGMVAVVASHGGRYTGIVATTIGLRGLITNDAGVGLNAAGIRSLELLDGIGLAAATIDHRSGRIGDGADCGRHGVLSYVNDAAGAIGCAVGQSAQSAAHAMLRAEPSSPQVVSLEEARFRLPPADAAVDVWGIDSASLAAEGDRGAILVTGSHGALLGGRPGTALKVDALAAVFNDAGGGPGGRGRSRLPALDDRGIAAVTVSAASAMIGSARSSFEDGVISATNGRAVSYGAKTGMKASVFVALMVGAVR